MKKSDLFYVRDATPDDENFIYSTWLMGLRHGNLWFNLFPKNAYFRTYHTIIERLLKNSDVKVKVAALKEQDDVILGYAVLEGDILHWIHVKDAWRRIGVATALIPKDIKYITHFTEVALAIKPAHLIFNPFLIQRRSKS